MKLLQNHSICLILSLGGGVCLVAPSAQAQTCYRLTDITELGFSTVSADDRFSINSAGEVVGSFVVNGQRHALLWLPQPNSNYDPPNATVWHSVCTTCQCCPGRPHRPSLVTLMMLGLW